MALALRQSAVCEQIMTVRRDSAPIIGRPIPYIWAEPDAPRRRQRRGLWRSRSPPGRQDEQALLAVEEDGGRRLADRGPSVSTTDAPSTAGARETGAYRGEDQQHLLNGRERRLRPQRVILVVPKTPRTSNTSGPRRRPTRPVRPGGVTTLTPPQEEVLLGRDVHDVDAAPGARG